MKESEKELFEKMLDASFKKKRAMEAGTRVAAVVNAAKKDFVFVTAKEANLQGIISSEEFADSPLPNPGDEIEAYFLREDHGDVHFTTCLSPDVLNKDLLEIAKRAEIPVLGQFISEGESGAEVKMGEFPAFCPFSQIDPEFKKSGLVGKRVKFLIQDIGTRGKLVVSQKRISDRAKEAKLGVLKQELKEGMFVTCKVKSIQNFGLIVEMDGLSALIPISEATYKKNPELDKEFQVGQTLRARVLRIDWENQKFALTVKDFLKDPWAQTVPFKEGDIVKGTIDSLKPFGLFVKLDDHFNGLVPGRETGIPNRIPLNQSFKQGDAVEVFVMEVNPERKQISLSIQKAKEIQERLDYSGYLSTDASGSTSSFGAILQNSLNKNRNSSKEEKHSSKKRK
ncbi:S1 RNA-binding domain-containing protein [Leptospira ellisii]|uniref:30S ribosomal protein S1 n=1 Tax=Leptospira ellisii TaxID=2023197 RepID=A0A2N0B6Q8_9LEPT|nr:S1 RNA-binding domain-containing protein [Leptospira ellisii]MDV6235876.1 S1 RNA-binding domain-containing protein [Leptospira ellisii]PJZ92158.1 30S ribosomal protein S1 [Leptospira ellisii]